MSAPPTPDVPTFPRRRGIASLAAPVPALTLLGCAAMMFACVANDRLGPHAVAFKLHYAQWFVLAAVALAGRRLLQAPIPALRAVAGSFLATAPLLLCFCALVGVHGLVSNGLDYQGMATDFWNADPTRSTSRRLALPALAHLLTLDLKLYVAFWYASFAVAFWAAVRLLRRRGLTPFEALSLATSSILAHALEAPGYGDSVVLLFGVILLLFRTTVVEKIVAAAFMVATHETAAPFAAAGLALAGDPEERWEWLAIFGLLYLALAGSFLATWHGDLGTALLTASKARPSDEVTSPDLLRAHPALALAGVLVSYKLCWLPVLAAVARPATRWIGALAILSLALVVAGSDTSRLVQFSSLAMFLCVSSELRNWPARARCALATGNLLVPSFYVATNAGLLWGPGLYSLYMRVGEALAVPMGRIFWE